MAVGIVGKFVDSVGNQGEYAAFTTMPPPI